MCARPDWNIAVVPGLRVRLIVNGSPAMMSLKVPRLVKLDILGAGIGHAHRLRRGRALERDLDVGQHGG